MKFIEEGHVYTDDNTREFTSVTKVIHSFEEPKDWDAIAKKYAKKNGLTVAEVKASWKEENEKSLVRGHAYHALKESEVNEAGKISINNIECAVKFYTPTEGVIHQDNCKLEDNTVYTEMMIWDEDSGICGKSDRVNVVDGYINVEDHKTNKEIKRKGFFVRNVGTEKLLTPLKHLDNCNWNVYCLQLSLYMYMLWKKNKNLRIGKLTLNHVTFKEDGSIDNIIVYDVPYLREEVKALIEAWKNKTK